MVAYNHSPSFWTLATLCRLAAFAAVAALLGHEAGALRTQNAGLLAMSAISEEVDLKSYDAVRVARPATIPSETGSLDYVLFAPPRSTGQ